MLVRFAHDFSSIQQKAAGMRRVSLFFGTPAMPSQSMCGNIGSYTYNAAAFPVLDPGQVTSTSSTSSEASSRTYLQAALHSSTMTPTRSPFSNTQTPLTRRDHQFQVECTKLDAALESYQYEGAKIILANMLSNDHTEWLKRLQHCLASNIPMTAPVPPPKNTTTNAVFAHTMLIPLNHLFLYLLSQFSPISSPSATVTGPMLLLMFTEILHLQLVPTMIPLSISENPSTHGPLPMSRSHPGHFAQQWSWKLFLLEMLQHRNLAPHIPTNI